MADPDHSLASSVLTENEPIVELIFSFLPPVVTLNTAARVCVLWRDVSRSDRVWRQHCKALFSLTRKISHPRLNTSLANIHVPTRETFCVWELPTYYDTFADWWANTCDGPPSVGLDPIIQARACAAWKTLGVVQKQHFSERRLAILTDSQFETMPCDALHAVLQYGPSDFWFGGYECYDTTVMMRLKFSLIFRGSTVRCHGVGVECSNSCIT